MNPSIASRFTDLATQAGEKIYAEPSTRASRAAAYDSMSSVERSAYLLNVLIGQVLNGGFHQWVGNGYALRLQETLAVVTAIGTPNSAAVAAALAALSPVINFEVSDEGCCGDYWVEPRGSRRGFHADDEEEGQDEEEQSPGVAIAESLDENFCEIYEAWTLEIEAWLADGAPNRSTALGPVKRAVLAPSTGPVRYPQVSVRLIGEDSNAFRIMGATKEALKQYGVSAEEIAEFQRQARSGDYDHLLQTCIQWVSVK